MPEVCSLPREIEALDRMFSFLERELGRHSIDERTAFCVNLAAEEVFTNMVRHNVVGVPEAISFEIDIADDRISLQLIDHDVEPWDPKDAPKVDPAAPAEARQPGGLGIHLVRSIVDKLSYEYEDRQMRVRVVKNRVH